MMGLNNRFKMPISFLSVATVVGATLLLTIGVMAHEQVGLGAQALLIFAVILFGPVTLLYLLSSSGEPVGNGILALPISALTALVAASLPQSGYSPALRRVGWFLWVLCGLMVAGWFI